MIPASTELLHLAWAQSWQVAFLICAVGLATRWLCQRRPHMAYVLWILVVLKCLTPPLMSSPMGLFSWMQARHELTSERADSEPTFLAVPAPATGISWQQSREEAALPQTPASAVSPIVLPLSESEISWQTGAVVVWATGFAVFAVIAFARWFQCWREASLSAVPTPLAIQTIVNEVAGLLGLRRKVRLVVTTAPVGPAATGLLRPVVILPRAMLSEMETDRIRPILGHELVHVRRGDVLFGLFQSAAQSLLWFHPLVWLANRQASRTVERCCDEEVIADLHYPPGSYASCLLDVLQFTRDRNSAQTFPGLGPRAFTIQRLRDIVKRENDFQRRTPRWCWLVLAALSFLILPGRGLVVGQNASPPADNGSTAGAVLAGTTIVGRVLDPSGNPAADVPISALVRSPTRDQRPGPAYVLAEGRTDARGSFRLIGRSVSLPQDLVLTVVACRAGSAVAWNQLAIATGTQEVTLQLDAEQPVELHVVDIDGKAVEGVKFTIQSIARNSSQQNLPHQWTAVVFPHDASASAPDLAMTDAQGRVALKGVHRGDFVGIECDDQRFAPEATDQLQTTDGRATLTLAPPQPLEGTVHLQDGGDTVAGALVKVISWHSTVPVGGYMYSGAGEARTNANGGFRVIPFHAEFLSIIVTAPHNGTFELVKWRDAKKVLASKQNLLVPQGTVVDGTVIEEASGKPIAGATVFYESPTHGHKPSLIEATSDADGRFVLTAGSGHGALLVRAPTPDYIKQDTTSGQAIYSYDKPSGIHLHPDGLALLDLKPDTKRQQVIIKLHRGVTVQGRAVDPDGKPVVAGQVITNTYAPYDMNFSETLDLPIRNGQFMIPGLDPEKEYRIYLVDPNKQCGATVMLPAKAAQPVEIHLEACGSATAQLVDPADHPYANYKTDDEPYISVSLIKAPGSSEAGIIDGLEIGFEGYLMENADPNRYQSLRADADGRITFPTLIPGADYRLMALNQRKSGDGKKDFTIQTGQTLDLGKITAEHREWATLR